MTGSITTVNQGKGFAFARPDDGSEDVFVALREVQSDVRQKLAKNSRVEFEVGSAEAGKKRPALNVRLVSDPSPATSNASSTTAPADPKPAATHGKPHVKIPENAVVADIALQFNDKDSVMLVAIQVNYGGVEITLLHNGDETDRGITDSEGKIEFALDIPKDEEVALIEVLVAEGTMPFKANWFRNPPAEPAKPKLEVKLRFREGNTYAFRIKTGPEKTVAVESACLISARKLDDSGWTAAARKAAFDSDEGGTLELEVKLVNAGDRGVMEFLANDLAHREYLTNDEPATPAAKE